MIGKNWLQDKQLLLLITMEGVLPVCLWEDHAHNKSVEPATAAMLLTAHSLSPLRCQCSMDYLPPP
ncbi:unnamed protein product [Eretmochelys imbricata]